MTTSHHRRDFLHTTTSVGVALSVSSPLFSNEQESPESKNSQNGPIDIVRVGIGVKGSAHLANLLRMDGVEVRAVWNYDSATEIRNGDFLEDYRLIQALRNGTMPDFDVYDAAAWSVIAPLSEESVKKRSTAIDVPDFTKGKWKERETIRICGV